MSTQTITPGVYAERHILYYWNTNSLAYEVATVPVAGGGGGAVTVADGADVAQGTTTDAAWSSGAGTVVALLKKIAGGAASDVTDRSARLLGHVTVDNASIPVTGTFYQTTQPVSIAATVNTNTGLTQPLTDTQLRATAVPVSGTFYQATQPVSLATNTPDVTDRAGRLLGTIANAAFTANQPANASVSSTAFTASDSVVGIPDGQGTLLSGSSTAGSVIAVAVPDGYSAWTLLLKGMATGQTVYTEASVNSTNGTDGDWVEIKGRRTGVAPGIEAVNYALTQSGIYRGTAGGMKWYRARLINATATTFPTASFTISAGTGAVFLNSGLPGGTSAIGTVTESSGALQALVAHNLGAQTDLLSAILRELRINNALLQSGLNVSDDLDTYRADPYFLQIA